MNNMTATDDSDSKERVARGMKYATGIIIALIVGVSATMLIRSRPAVADVKRLAEIPKSFWGAWAPNADACANVADQSIITLSGKSYTSSQTSCSVINVSETPGTNRPTYSARLKCIGQGQTQPTPSNLILRSEDLNRISIGSEFATLNVYQKCSAKGPVTKGPQ
ncbi:hypothetical protein [Bradyrhizobium sp. NAS80.1]|uniref:hypothetical protein n=1 Tax=Bradyrhizobium sp. NAS80.1 TaxID=1680159 RepID=UPI001161086B|nr:hypothetical protein [Bradyrhizobium sp. NAS80.1]